MEIASNCSVIINFNYLKFIVSINFQELMTEPKKGTHPRKIRRLRKREVSEANIL